MTIWTLSMKRLAHVLTVVLVLAPAVALAQVTNLSGTYIAQGQNPTGPGTYRGEVAIAQSGDTFQVIWRIGDQQYEGTGMLRDGKLAVVFRSGAQSGVVFYDVRDNGTLTGTWTMLGERSIGTETLTPNGRT